LYTSIALNWLRIKEISIMGDEILTKIDTAESLEPQNSIAVSEIKEQDLSEVPKKRWVWLIPMFVGLGLGGAIALGATQLKSTSNVKSTNAPNIAQTTAPSQTVTVGSVDTVSIPRSLNAKGTIAARNLISIVPQRGGQIKQILVKEGQTVKIGQSLAYVDDAELQIQINQAQAQVQSSQGIVQQRQAALAEAKSKEAGARASEQEALANLAQAQARQLQAQQKLKRYGQLAAQGAISQDTFQGYQTDSSAQTELVRAAQAKISSAKESVKSSLAAITSAQASIGSAQADVRNSMAKVDQLRAQVGQTIVRAPAAGVITRPQVEGKIQEIAQIGDFSSSAKPLFSIISNNQLELQAEVPASQLPQIDLGAPAQITAEADNRVRIKGQVRNVEQLVNSGSRQAIVKIDFPPTDLLRPGMFAKAAIVTSTAMGTTVPAKAVQFQPDKSAVVFVLAGEDQVRAQKVEVGEPLNDNRVEIRTGLKPGDRIVIAGAGYIKDGDRVRIAASK
jgi:HlyD family secretion protein